MEGKQGDLVPVDSQAAQLLLLVPSSLGRLCCPEREKDAL